MTIIGAGFGKGDGGGSSRTPSTAKDSLDSRQYANVIDLISEGEIEGLVQQTVTIDGAPTASTLPSIYLNNTPIQNLNGTYNFEDVEIYTRNGTQNQTYIPLSPGVEDEKPVGLTIVKDVPLVRSITDVDVDAVRVTIAIPALQRIDPNTGNTNGASVQLKIAVQYAGGGFTDQAIGLNGATTDTITGRTGDEYRKDYLIQLARPNPSDSVDIRVTRVTADSTSALLSNAFNWQSYTEIIWAKLRYPNSALVGLRVDAEQFNSIPSRSYLIKGIKVAIPAGVSVDPQNGRIIYPENFVWNGTFAAATWTACPAWILYDLLTSSRYGFGEHIDAAQLDKWAFFAASKYANELVDDGFGGTEVRFSCNATIQTAEEAYKLVNDLLSVMRCQGFWSSGSMTIAQDRPSDPAFLFTASNVTPEGFNYSGSSLKTRPNVAVVSYLDIGRYNSSGVWQPGLRDTAYEVVEDTEAIDKYGAVRTEISAFACTSRAQANRIGRWLLYSERYEKEVVSFTSSLDAGQQVRPGQIILIADPVKAGSRRGGRVNTATTTVITVDNTSNTDLSYSPGASTLSVILPDGTVEQQPVLDITGANITVTTPFSVAPNSNSLWVLESPTLETSTWRVLSVQEQDSAVYTITAIAYNASKYDYIENGFELQQRDTTDLNVIPDAPSGLQVLDIPVPGGGTTKEVQYELNGRIAIKVTFSWLGPKGIKNFRVKYRHEDDNFTTRTVQGTTFDIEDVRPGAYEIQVSSISASNVLYSSPAIATYIVEGISAAPLDVTGLTLVPISEALAVLTWNQSSELDVRVGGKVIIRHDPRNLATAEWSYSSQIVDAVAGNATQKQVPLLPGTYFVKFEDYLGNRSTNATSFEVALPEYESRLQLNLYTTIGYAADYYFGGVQWEEENLATPYSGTKVNCLYDGTETALVIDLDLYVALDYYEPIYAEGDGEAEYYFSETLELGDVFDVNFRRYVLIRSLPTSGNFDSASGLFDERTGFFDGNDDDAINIVTYIRATDDNPAGTPVWGPWTELINGVVQGRAFQVKAILSTDNDSVNIAVESLRMIPELVRRVTSSSNPSTASLVTYEHAFYDIYAVSITPVELLSDERYLLSNVTTTGFEVDFYAGAATIEKAYHYTATGFGRAL
jgi:predicted phage tail protein